MATKTKTQAEKVQTEEQKAQEQEGIIVADEKLLTLCKKRESIDATLARYEDRKKKINGQIKDILAEKDAKEIVDAKGNRLWNYSPSYYHKFDVDAMVKKYPILKPLVKQFSSVNVVYKLYFTKPKE